jgi:Raf kinase inhibitor-like YbhB/YbcL family protein
MPVGTILPVDWWGREPEELAMMGLDRDRPPGSLRGIWLVVLGSAVGCGGGVPSLDVDSTKMTIHLSSSAFAEGGMIPKEYTCSGADKSPPLEWTGVPPSAHALALICDDPDAPVGTFSHWVVHDLPPETTKLAEGISPETGPPALRQGKNDFGKLGYGGPCPPSGTHRYFFRLYALDAPLNVGPAATRVTVLKAIEGHILAEGRLMGRYAR